MLQKPDMRTQLAPYAGQRLGFDGYVANTGVRPVGETLIRTICFADVVSGPIKIDHAWVDATPEMDDLEPGDWVCFTALVRPYTGLLGSDYELCEVEDVWVR